LLPALPEQWPVGEVSGLRAVGGYEIDMAWKDGALEKAVIEAKYDGVCRLRTKSPVKIFVGGKEIPYKQVENNLLEFEVNAGNKYIINKL